MSSIQDYLDLITSEHNKQPKFMAMLAGVFQPFFDGLVVAQSLPGLYDLDVAVGIQLDAVGVWVGKTRGLKVAITGVYFTYNDGPGYNNGIYKGPFDPDSGLTQLPDPQYRLYLKAVIAANHWDGTTPGAYAAYAIVLQGTPFSILIYDYQDMSISYALLGGIPDPLTLALFTQGYLSLKPDGVRIREYVVPVVPGLVFAYNLTTNPNTAGYNNGHYAKRIPA